MKKIVIVARCNIKIDVIFSKENKSIYADTRNNIHSVLVGDDYRRIYL